MLGKFKPQISQISADVSEVWKIFTAAALAALPANLLITSRAAGV